MQMPPPTPSPFLNDIVMSKSISSNWKGTCGASHQLVILVVYNYTSVLTVPSFRVNVSSCVHTSVQCSAHSGSWWSLQPSLEPGGHHSLTNIHHFCASSVYMYNMHFLLVVWLYSRLIWPPLHPFWAEPCQWIVRRLSSTLQAE